MVRNKTGGNKSKKSARKHLQTSDSSYNRKLRFIEEEGENYAVVIKLLGGSNCEVVCNDGINRQCIIRNKFRGRDKRDNNIAPGVWILVGVRDWEARSNKAAKCDLLEVYSSNEKDKLKANSSINFTALTNALDDGITKFNDNIIFEDDTITSHKNNILNEIQEGEDENEEGEVREKETNSDDDFIDIDEI